jgi:metallo-beta-lactamase family protein
VGYQAEGTRGRKLLNGEHKLMTREREIDVNLNVDYINFSAHADHEQLINFAKSVRGLKKVFIIHGEPKKSEELGEHLQKLGMDVTIPKIGEYFTLP